MSYKIEDDPAFKAWKENLKQQRLERMETEMRFSIQRITQYMEYRGAKTLSELLSLRRERSDSTEDEILHKYLNQLAQKGISKMTVEKHWVVIRGFYKHLGVPLTKHYPEELRRRASMAKA